MHAMFRQDCVTCCSSIAWCRNKKPEKTFNWKGLVIPYTTNVLSSLGKNVIRYLPTWSCFICGCFVDTFLNSKDNANFPLKNLTLKEIVLEPSKQTKKTDEPWKNLILSVFSQNFHICAIDLIHQGFSLTNDAKWP